MAERAGADVTEHYASQSGVQHVRPPETWVLVLNRYQRDNLLWLVNACGYGDAGVEPFTFANNGDWIGEIAWMLGKARNGQQGESIIKLDENDHPNGGSLDQLRARVEMWKEADA